MAAPSPAAGRRLAWVVGRWLAGVLTVGAVSFLIRAWLL